MPAVILTLDDDERDQRDKMIFEISKSQLALEQAIGELLVLRKLKSAVKAGTRQTPKVSQVLSRFPARTIHVTAKCEPERVEQLKPIDPERNLWYADS